MSAPSSIQSTIASTAIVINRRVYALTSHLTASSSATAMSLETNPVASSSSSSINISVSTHVLNTSSGFPAADVLVTFESLTPGSDNDWKQLGEARTNTDGRVGAGFVIHTTATKASYRLRFATAAYFEQQGIHDAFFPQVTIEWQVTQEKDKERTKLHVPLLISPYGYSSYRGS